MHTCMIYQLNAILIDLQKKKKKKKKESASHSILYYLDSWNPRDHGELEKKKKFNQRFEISKYVEQSKYTMVQRNV